MKLRLAFIMAHFDTGGAERIVLSLLQNLDRAKVTPTLILLKDEGRLRGDLPDDVEVVVLGKSKTRDAVLALRDIFGTDRFDVTYSVTNAMNILALVAARLSKAPPKIIVSDHTPLGMFLQDKKFRLMRTGLIRALYARADHLCAPVQDICEEYSQILGVEPARMTVLDNPVLEVGAALKLDSELVKTLENLPRPVVMSVGRLSVEKGTDVLIRAFAAARDRSGTGSLAIFGDGDFRSDLENLVQELGMADHVHFLGNVSGASAYLSIGDVFALTSRREGFGNVLIEAMDARLPVLAVDCPFGPRRILDMGALGHLVPLDDMAALESGLLKMMTDQDYRDSFISAAYEKAQRYRADAATRQFETLLARVV